MGLIRRYIDLCKRKNPGVPPALTDYIVDAYVEMRKDARNNKVMFEHNNGNRKHLYINLAQTRSISYSEASNKVWPNLHIPVVRKYNN